MTHAERRPSTAASPQAPIVPLMMTPTPSDSGDYRVVIAIPGPNKIRVIKALREISGASLVDAKFVSENPGYGIGWTDRDTALQVLQKLQAAGAVAELKSKAGGVDAEISR